MDGDFAPMIELVKLRKKYGFLLVIDDVSPNLLGSNFSHLENAVGYINFMAFVE